MRAKDRLTAGFLKSPPVGKHCDGAGLWLAAARKLAGRWRDVAAAGRDPIKEREAEERAARREDITLAILTADAFEARKAELKGDGTAGRWLPPLTLHVLPKLGRVPVTDLDQRDIRDTPAPFGIPRPRRAQGPEPAGHRLEARGGAGPGR